MLLGALSSGLSRMLINSKTATILIVEDDPVHTHVLDHLLKTESYNLLFANNGKTALPLIKKHKPDLILCDWMMPEISGINLCKIIKSNPEFQGTIFILLTGKNSAEDQIFGLEAGADDFINKPIQKNQLLARVQAGLRQKRLYDELQVSNLELKETQAQLIQTKKMASLSKVVAGIAHEINNPVTFIHGNLNHTQTYIDDLQKLVQLFRAHYTDLPPHINEFIEEVDLEYLLEDLPLMLNSMQQGTIRIKNIVKSLRTFAGLDEAETKTANLNDCLNTVIDLMQAQLKTAGIEVICNYQELPDILCNCRDINQALMHLLSNAIEAIAQKKKEDVELEGKILIKTEYGEQGLITISILDNGSGVKAEDFEKIFDPFFTTKEIGEGTGIGLSIVYRIIQQHQGKVFCNAYMDAGTEFVIHLPVPQGGLELLR